MVKKGAGDSYPLDGFVEKRRLAAHEQLVTSMEQEQAPLAASLRLLRNISGLSVEQIMQFGLEEAVILTGSQIGYFHLVNWDEQTIALTAWSRRTFDNCSVTEGTAHYPISKAGVWVDCIHQGKPVIHNDYEALPHKRGLPKGHAPVIRDLSVPVFEGSKIAAVLGVGNKLANYTDADADQLSLFAEVIWFVVQRKRAEQVAADEKQATDALRQSQERYQELFNIMLDGYALHEMIFDDDGTPIDYRFLDINPAFEKMTGLGKNIIGKRVLEVLPELEPYWIETYGKVTLTGEPTRFENYSGGVGQKWFEVVAFKTQENQFATIFQDITEHKHAKERIHEQQQFLTNTLNSLMHPFYVINIEDYTLSLANSAALQGKPLNGLTCYALAHQQDRPCEGPDHICPLKEIKQHKGHVRVEHLHYDAEGNPHHVEIHAQPLIKSDGQFTQIIEYCIDVTEQKEAEQAAALAQHRFEQTLANLSLIAVMLDTKGRITFANRYLLDLTGWTEEEAIGTLWFENFLPEDVSRDVRKIFKSSFDDQIPAHFENEIITRDGERRMIQWSNTFLKDIHGNTIGTSSIGEDITTRKQAEEALRISEAKFRDIVENAVPIIFMIDRDGIFTLSEGEQLSGLGVVPGQVVGMSALEIYKDYPAITDALKATWRGEFVRDPNLCVAGTDGKPRYFDIFYSPHHGKNDEIIGTLGMAIDITKRKNAEEEIRRLNAGLERRVAERTAELSAEKKQSETILNNVADAILFTDIDGKILYVSPAWERLTGYTLYEAIGQNPRIMQSEQTPTETYKAMWQTILDGNIWRGVLVNKRKNGSLYDAELTVAPVYDERSEISHFVGIQRDVTEQLKLADMKERFIADAAHDLGNPVTVLKTSLYLLKKSPDKREERIGRLEYATNRLENLVRDLLTISRLDRKIMIPERLPLNLSTLVGEVVEAQRIVADENKQTLLYEPTEDMPLIMADAQQLERVAVNLLANALRYTPEGGSIHIETRQEFDEVVLAIQDTGIGISQKDLPHIFERFYRSSPARVLADGTGLGLSIVKEIVELHHGRIEVESQIEKGSRFSVYLPIQS